MSTSKNSISSRKELRHNLESKIETLVAAVYPAADKKSKKTIKKAARVLADGLYVKPKKKAAQKTAKPAKKAVAAKKTIRK
jgi:peptidoglycan hydrolase CwlO-like protein